MIRNLTMPQMYIKQTQKSQLSFKSSFDKNFGKDREIVTCQGKAKALSMEIAQMQKQYKLMQQKIHKLESSNNNNDKSIQSLKNKYPTGYYYIQTILNPELGFSEDYSDKEKITTLRKYQNYEPFVAITDHIITKSRPKNFSIGFLRGNKIVELDHKKKSQKIEKEVKGLINFVSQQESGFYKKLDNVKPEFSEIRREEDQNYIDKYTSASPYNFKETNLNSLFSIILGSSPTKSPIGDDIKQAIAEYTTSEMDAKRDYRYPGHFTLNNKEFHGKFIINDKKCKVTEEHVIRATNTIIKALNKQPLITSFSQDNAVSYLKKVWSGSGGKKVEKLFKLDDFTEDIIGLSDSIKSKVKSKMRFSPQYCTGYSQELEKALDKKYKLKDKRH